MKISQQSSTWLIFSHRHAEFQIEEAIDMALYWPDDIWLSPAWHEHDGSDCTVVHPLTIDDYEILYVPAMVIFEPNKTK